MVALKGEHRSWCHMGCVGGVIRKLYVRQEVISSSSGCGVNFLALHRPFYPGCVGIRTNDPESLIPHL